MKEKWVNGDKENGETIRLIRGLPLLQFLITYMYCKQYLIFFFLKEQEINSQKQNFRIQLRFETKNSEH